MTLFDEASEKFVWNLIIIGVFTIINYILYVYHEERKDFTIYDAFYYTISTHFTLGFGDIIPKSVIGKMMVFLHAFLVWAINLVSPQKVSKYVVSSTVGKSKVVPIAGFNA
jgi:ABC-type multidrug transport system permease subunit